MEKDIEKEAVFKPKMRVTLMNSLGVPLSDRLVDAYSELLQGPKINHQGPIRLEVTLTNKEDINGFKEYIDRLTGSLPLKSPSAGRGRPSGNSSEKAISEPREEILGDIKKMESEGKSQKDVISYLRGLGFIFILTEDFLQYFPDFEFNKKDIGEPNGNKQYPESLSWMVRQIKKAKDIKADKYDPSLIFGFSIIKGSSKKVVPYLYKERQEPLKLLPPEKALSFSKVGFTKYPVYMTEEERFKFSTEIRQLLNQPEKKPSKFFLRWYKDVVFPNNIKDDLLNRCQQQ